VTFALVLSLKHRVIRFIHSPFIYNSKTKNTATNQSFHSLSTPTHTTTNTLTAGPVNPLPIMHFSTTAIAVLATAASAAALPTTNNANNNQSANPSSLARRAVSGKSTFYGGNVQGGTCSFSTYKLPAGLYGTAFSGQVWNSAANCGGCVKVSHGGKSITAMVRKKPIKTKEDEKSNQTD
jgi:hypothetical protein